MANLYYYGARWYDPWLGQFTQPDSLVPDPLNPIALNRYAYAYNSPLVYTDPSGHIGVPAIALIAALGFLGGEIYAGTQGYTPLDAEFWHYSLGAAAFATSSYLLAADLALVAGYGLQGVGLWSGSTTLFGWGMRAGGLGAAMYAWAFQPLDIYSRRIKRLMAQDVLTAKDLVKLEKLIRADLRISGVSIGSVESTSIAGRYEQWEGRPGVLDIEMGSGRSTLIHEWMHFNQHRMRGWRISTELEYYLGEIEAHRWQLSHAKDLGLGPYETRHHETMVEHYRRLINRYYPGRLH